MVFCHFRIPPLTERLAKVESRSKRRLSQTADALGYYPSGGFEKFSTDTSGTGNQIRIDADSGHAAWWVIIGPGNGTGNGLLGGGSDARGERKGSGIRS